MTHKFDANLLKYYDYVIDTNSFIFLFTKIADGQYKIKDNIKSIFINSGTYTLESLLTYYTDATDESIVDIDINNVTEIYIEDDAEITIDGITTSFFEQTLFPLSDDLSLKRLTDFLDIPILNEQAKILRVNDTEDGFILKSFSESFDLTIVEDFTSVEDDSTGTPTESPSALASKTYADDVIIVRHPLTVKNIDKDTWNDIEASGIYTDEGVNRTLNDFYIPSLDEFNLIEENLPNINLKDEYWTSSEKDSSKAYIKQFNKRKDGVFAISNNENKLLFAKEEYDLNYLSTYIPDGNILTIDKSNDSKVLFIGGSFNNIGATARGKFAEFVINSDGNYDLSDTNIIFDGDINVIKISSNNNFMFVGGNFTSVNGNVNYKYLVKLDFTDYGWGLDTTFNPILNNSVNDIIFTENNETIFIGGTFNLIDTKTKPYIAKFDFLNNEWHLSNWDLTITGSTINTLEFVEENITEIDTISSGISDYNSSFADNIVYNNKLYFSAYNGSINKIYEYDGSTIKNINAGISDYVNSFTSPIVYNNKLYFQGNDSVNNKIYEYDGTTINDIDAGTSGYIDIFQNPIVYNNKLYFQGNDSVNNKIYEYDGTTINIVDTGTSGYASDFSSPIIYNNKLYFQGNDGVSKILEFDGTTINDIDAGTSGYASDFSSPIVYNNKLYFQGNNGISKILEFDGITINDIDVGTSEYSAFFISPIVYNNKLYFESDNSIDYRIFEYDGITINDIDAGTSGYASDFSSPIVYNNKLYFQGNDGASKILEFDGTTINDIDAGTSDYTQIFSKAIVYNGKLYFYGYTGSIYKIFEYDGNTVNNVNAGTTGYTNNFDNPIIYNTKLYFLGNDGTNKILEYDGTIENNIYLFIGGAFSNINGFSIHNLAKLNPEYTLDQNFDYIDSGVGLYVSKIIFNKIYLGFIVIGNFESINGDTQYEDIIHFDKYINLDTTFKILFNNTISDIEFIDNYKSFLVSGSFTQISINDGGVWNTFNQIAKFNYGSITPITVSNSEVVTDISRIINMDYEADSSLKYVINKIVLVRNFISDLNYSIGDEITYGLIFNKIDNLDGTFTYYEFYNFNLGYKYWSSDLLNTLLGTTESNGVQNTLNIIDGTIDSIALFANKYKKINDIKSPHLGKDFYGIVFFIDNNNISQILYDFYNNEYHRFKINGVWGEWNNPTEKTFKNIEIYQDKFKKPLTNLISNNFILSDISLNNLTYNLKKITYSEELELFVGINPTTNNISYSKDGILWSTTEGMTSGSSLNDIIYSKELNMFIICGEGFLSNNIIYSFNGIDWFNSTIESDTVWNTISYSPELKMFVVASSGLEIAYSYDGINWEFTSAIADVEWSSIVWSPYLKLFVGVSSSGATATRVMYSYNGIRWFNSTNVDTVNDDLFFSKVIWNENQNMFIAIGTDSTTIESKLMYSNNGKNWKYKTILDNTNMKNIFWISKLELYIASGISGEIYISKYGLIWKKIYHKDIDEINDIIYSNILNKIVIIGRDVSLNYYSYVLDINYNNLFED